MKKLYLSILFCITIINVCDAQTSKWSIEMSGLWGVEEDLGLMGIEHSTKINYSIIDRGGVSLSLGQFQSLTQWQSWDIQNASEMIVSANLFGDILKYKRNRLRLRVGASYFRGDISHANWFVRHNGIWKPLTYDVYIYNNIGMNLNLSYIHSFSDNWYMGVNIQGYEIFDGILDWRFIHILSGGLSVGYNF